MEKPLMGNLLAPEIQPVRALQQPEWDNQAQVKLFRELLGSYAPLVRAEDVDVLRAQLSRAAQGGLYVLQAGDCAEDPTECAAEHIQRKTTLLDLLAGMLERATGTPALRVGRIAGQFAKPRSAPVELVGGLELPVYRGHLVNGPGPTPESRRPDPRRLLIGYMAASEIMMRLGWRVPGVAPAQRATGPTVWTSHEALLLDYEQPLVREHPDGRRWLSSTHWPWIGERTRQLDGPHVALLAQVVNPVGCKVGPGMGADEIVELCDRLDRDREPGRLTLIARMGADAVADRLPPLVEAVRAAGHPVIWLCDPLHGNTVTAHGRKTRFVSTVTAEVCGFRRAVELAGGVAGGLHLETTPDDVTECVTDASAPRPGARRYTSLCDPRLNPGQAADVVDAWSDLDRTSPYGVTPYASRLYR
jgi:3-deoxy-7-phosphoheptulonate synthase